MRLRKIGLVTLALVSAAIGAHTLNLRELYNEMYPLEPVKRDAFHICDDSDPTFVRAVSAEREACYSKMPHIMAVAMGRIKPGGALTMQAMTDPSREAELLMLLASTPPRQPITAPRSFSNTAWVRALSPPCEEKHPSPAVAYTVPGTLPAAPGTGRAAALDSAIRNNLPALPPRAVKSNDPPDRRLPVIALAPDQSAAAPSPGAGGNAAAGPFAPLPAPDVGDAATPAIVPLAPADNRCGGA
ncbi:MAG TPA: hypothetical protein VG651_15435 [Stellaceae bacterium]|nr:hypothetical protein [Stellaceae bacterium]